MVSLEGRGDKKRKPQGSFACLGAFQACVEDFRINLLRNFLFRFLLHLVFTLALIFSHLFLLHPIIFYIVRYLRITLIAARHKQIRIGRNNGWPFLPSRVESPVFSPLSSGA
jgi:hypothetical protein